MFNALLMHLHIYLQLPQLPQMLLTLRVRTKDPQPSYISRH